MSENFLDIDLGLYNFVNSPIVVLCDKFKILHCNRSFFSEFGYEGESLLGHSFLDYVFPKDNEMVKAALEYSIEDQEFELTFRIREQKRGYVWFSGMFYHKSDDQNSGIYIINLESVYAKGDMHDFSHKAAISQYDNYLGSRFVMDSTGAIIANNIGLLELIGVEESVLKSKGFESFVHSEASLKLYKGELSSLLKGERKEGRIGIDIKLPNGDPYYSLLYMFCYEVDGRTLISHSLDINSKEILEYERNLEEKVNLLKLSEKISGVGHWQIDLKSKKLTWSDEIYRIHELQPDKYIPTIESAMEFYHPEDRIWIRQYIEDAMEKKEPFEFELRIITDKGNLKHVFSKAYIRFGDNGEVESIFGIFQDLTEIKESELKLSKMVDELRVSNQELERFAYFASHDMQEPLRTINSFADILKSKIGALKHDDPDIITYFDYVQQSARQMQTLVRDLVDYSKSQESYEKREVVDLKEVSEHVVSSLSEMISMENASVNIKGDMPILNANNGGVSRLLQNIISNALKYRREDVSPVIDVYAEDLGNVWAIFVKDNGIGIDDQYKDQIFEPFKRLHSKFEYSGSGIGLAVCKRIVSSLGGELGFSNNADYGVTFRFTIPKRIQ